MKGVVTRIGLLFKAGWQWLMVSPHYRGTLLCGLSLVGAIIAIGYNGGKSIFGRSAPVTYASDVVAARISAMSGGSGTSNAANSLTNDRGREAEVAEPSLVHEDFRIRKEGQLAKAIASDKSFLVADTEKQKTEIRDKEEVKKTAKKPAKKTQRRVSSDKDRKFNPSRDIKRAGENITRVLRDIF
jgi:hypothetical protein